MHSPTFATLRDLASAEPVSIAVRGACMEPRLRHGLTVRVSARKRYYPGDVIVFLSRGHSLTVHRVLGWRPAGLVTKGDHCATHDAAIARDSIIGAVECDVAIGDRIRALASLARIVIRKIAL